MGSLIYQKNVDGIQVEIARKSMRGRPPQGNVIKANNGDIIVMDCVTEKPSNSTMWNHVVIDGVDLWHPKTMNGRFIPHYFDAAGNDLGAKGKGRPQAGFEKRADGHWYQLKVTAPAVTGSDISVDTTVSS